MSTVLHRPRVSRYQHPAKCPPTASVPLCRPSPARPALNAGARNRRYAAVLSRLNKQTGTSSQPSSSAFSGYVPKCKQHNSVQCKNTVTKSVSDGSTEQRRTKVSFCLQTSQDDEICKRETTSLSSKCVSSASSSVASSVTLVTCSKTTTSTTTSLPPLTTVSSSQLNVADVPYGLQMPANTSDISLLCAELFVDNNASFCDQLLENCPLPYEPPEVPNTLFNSKQDIPAPIVDLAFDDFVEFDELFGCSWISVLFNVV